MMTALHQTRTPNGGQPLVVAVTGHRDPVTSKIDANANGTYNYSWTVQNDPSAAPRTGRIMVDQNRVEFDY